MAISPILLYIGMIIGAQAFQECPKKHAPAIVLSLTPHLAAWAKTVIIGSLAGAGTVFDVLSDPEKTKLFAGMNTNGVLFQGMLTLGGGSILGGLILGAIGALIIDRNFKKAGYFAFAGAILTFFGFMHGEKIGFAQTPTVAFSYLVVGGILMACAMFAEVPKPVEEPHEEMEGRTRGGLRAQVSNQTNLFLGVASGDSSVAKAASAAAGSP